MAIVGATEEDARQVASAILEVVTAPAAGRLVELDYDPDQPFAGGTFDDRGGGALSAPNSITEADLLAVSLLDVPFPPTAVRRLLGDDTLITAMNRLLKKVPTNADLWDVERAVLEAADQAWAELVKLPGVGPVRAGKLLARKRPRVVPIWDDVVAAAVGEMRGDWWSVLKRCLQQELDLRTRIDALRPAASVSVIRTLDVLIWMTRGSSDNATAARAEAGMRP